MASASMGAVGLIVVFAFTHIAGMKGSFLSGNTAFVR
jgi:hypothetical protein